MRRLRRRARRLAIGRREVLNALAALSLSLPAKRAAARVGAVFHGGAVGQSSTGIGYSVIVTMDAGPVYTYDPDTPDSHTTVANQQPFVSDFAAFTQGSVHCMRDDTALRVYFRKDISPDPSRIEIILELGHFTFNGSAANLGPFTLQIFKAGVAQSVPYVTLANRSGTSTSPHFPSMGWFTRWRWNPTPRARLCTAADLLPGGQNLVPNYSNTQAIATRCVNTGPGSESQVSRPFPISAYSSAFFTGRGNDLNPVGVNENCGLFVDESAPGDRPELGIVNEWAANWLCNGNTYASTALNILPEIAGGQPQIIRDSSTNWAPVDFFAKPTMNFSSLPTGIHPDLPLVTCPSTGTVWQLNVAHTPTLCYVSYLLTGDPFILENLQFSAAWMIGYNFYARDNGFPYNLADVSASPAFPPDAQMFGAWRIETRAFAWSIRTFTECYLATPASVPDWLLPQSYFKAMLDHNAALAKSWGPDYPVDHAALKQYPGVTAQGTGVCEESESIGVYMNYLMYSLAFAVNQGGLTNWRDYWEYSAKMPVGMLSGLRGWDPRFPSPYYYHFQGMSTDYSGSPATISNLADGYTFWVNNASAWLPTAWTVSGLTGGMASIFSSWQPSAAYHCNSWMYRVRSGAPVLPNAGDVVSITISGSFSGSPVTLSHTINSSDITAITTIGKDPSAGSPNPVINDLIAQINAQASLSAAGIKASHTNDNGGVGSRQFLAPSGTLYISFNSDGTSTLGGPVIGPITVTGSFTTSTNNSLYIQPNGDGVHNGVQGPNLLGRAISYQCAKSGTSAGSGGPTGTALQTIVNDGTAAWCFAPEFISWPGCVPGGPIDPLPAAGFGGPFGISGAQYITFAFPAMAMCRTGAVADSTAAYNNIAAISNWYFNTWDTSAETLWSYAIVP